MQCAETRQPKRCSENYSLPTIHHSLYSKKAGRGAPSTGQIVPGLTTYAGFCTFAA
jgi:hypothetical protein